ncbi:MAG: hypothetical protein RBS73_18105, partial [Prolixibacteraceae bacterium]|nr:hypothetical protein [Prolixibacteraceae bacterium]
IAGRLPPGRACFLLGFTNIKVREDLKNYLKIMLHEFGLQHRRTRDGVKLPGLLFYPFTIDGSYYYFLVYVKSASSRYDLLK